MSQYWVRWSTIKALVSRFFRPSAVYQSVETIDMRALYLAGYRTVILDLDNTIMSYNEHTLSLQKMTWIETVKSLGFHVLIVSNNRSQSRVESVCQAASVQGMRFACKPWVSAFQDFLNHSGLYVDAPVVIGDQLFTDIVFANRLGGYGILVQPLDPSSDSILKVPQREIERALLRWFGFA
jgi:uncharacterized protein